MKGRTVSTTLLCAYVLAALGGCATYHAYPGPELHAEAIALVRVPGGVTALDGVVIEHHDVRRIGLLPGSHEIEWIFRYPNRYEVSRTLRFDARAGRRYELDHRFFPAPHPGGFIGAAGEFVLDTVTLPLRLFIPEETPTAPPEGVAYAWILDLDTRTVVAGEPPDLPMGHHAITFLADE